MNRQEMFDKALQGVRRQGKQSRTFAGCVYRVDAPEGERRCAVGHLLEGEILDKAEENGGSVTHLVSSGLKLGLGEDTVEGKNFLDDLQYAHDYASQVNFVDEFANRMQYVAKKWHLAFPENI